jgi:hypothetical protein
MRLSGGRSHGRPRPVPRLSRRLAAWGADASQRWVMSPADAVVIDADERWVRGIEIEAPPALVWAWLCQLRAAPYSYDWIDNFGRRSPQHVVPGLGDLAAGQAALRIFRVVDFMPLTYMTIKLAWSRGRTLPYARSYVLTLRDGSASSLVVHVRGRYPRRLPKKLGRVALGAVCALDFVMSRQQLHNLKRLAERDARAVSSPLTLDVSK